MKMSHEHIQIYICKTDASIKINQEEISEGRYLDWAILQDEIQKNPDQFTSSFKFILKNYTDEIIDP